MEKSALFLITGLVFGYSSSAANLIPNGDFEAGLSDFTSDYTLANGTLGSLVPESTYLVGTDPSLYHGLFSTYGDHTSGSGQMLIANGSNDTTDIVWKSTSTIPVTRDTLYYFEAWMSSAHPDSPAELSFRLDGDVSDATLGTGTAPGVTGVWESVSLVWNSGANTSVTLFLQNANPARGGNDFAIDDIHFGETSSVPDSSSSLTLASIGLAACAVASRRLRRA